MSLFSKNLRFLRKKGGHNQEEISLLFKKRPNTVGNWENEKSEPSLTELGKLSEFFKVNPHQLLNSDMEAGLPAHSYIIDEPLSTLAKESSPDAFWVIMRELRALNEKVDLLLSNTESGSIKKNSDKSYH